MLLLTGCWSLWILSPPHSAVNIADVAAAASERAPKPKPQSLKPHPGPKPLRNLRPQGTVTMVPLMADCSVRKQLGAVLEIEAFGWMTQVFDLLEGQHSILRKYGRKCLEIRCVCMYAHVVGRHILFVCHVCFVCIVAAGSTALGMARYICIRMMARRV